MLHNMKGFVASACMMLILSPVASVAGMQSHADLVEKLMPAVVNISTTQNVEARRSGPQNMLPPGTPFEDMFRDFFDRFGGPEGNRGPGGAPRGPARRVQSLGSGFIIDENGYVVTNNHVIESADEIEVILQDGTELPATLVGRDPKTDLAVLKVEADEKLPFVSFGDSDGLRVGDHVLAIGNPFGLGGSVSAGIVSARHRQINSGPYDDFIQTDAPINRGNSGGPLFDLDGKVVGVNTAIISPTGGSVGIGFSIPANLAKGVVAQLKEFGQTRRGWLGVRIQVVTDDIADSVGLDGARGALVAGIAEDGPSAKADIQAGDIILKFDGKDVDRMQDLPRIVAETDVGKTVSVELWRDGQKRVVDVTIALLDESQVVAQSEAQSDTNDVRPTRLGMTFSNLSDEFRQRFQIPSSIRGVIIVDVDPNSQAAEKGIQAGMVIDKIFSEEIATPQDALEAIDRVYETGGATILLRLNEGGQFRFVALRLEKR